MIRPLRKLQGRRNGTNGGMCTQTFPKLLLYLDSPDKLDMYHHLQYRSHCLYSESHEFVVDVCSTASEYLYFHIHSGISADKRSDMVRHRSRIFCQCRYMPYLVLILLYANTLGKYYFAFGIANYLYLYDSNSLFTKNANRV